jgi:hypothetical protein
MSTRIRDSDTRAVSAARVRPSSSWPAVGVQGTRSCGMKPSNDEEGKVALST